MEGGNVHLVDDNCSQIEVAFKRMKVGTSRCTGKKSHHHIYNHHQSNHYHHHHHTHHPPQQLTPSPPPQHQPNHQQDQLSPPQTKQLSHHLPDPHQSHLSNQIISPNKTRVNPYYNQMFNTNTRVIPESVDDDTVDRLSSVDKSETISFSSFSASPLAQLNNFPSSSNTSSLSSLSSSSSSSFSSSSSSSSISPSSAVTPLSSTCTFMGPYRDVAHSEGQTDNLDHNHPNNHHSNQNNNNNNYHLNQSNHEDGPTADPDVSVEELAAYLDVQLYIPRKMSYMAELMYT